MTRFRTRATASLFAYLAYHTRRAHPREELIERFWAEDDFDTGRRKLNVAVSALRGQLEPIGVPDGAVLTADRQFVGLDPASVETDAAEFEGLLAAPLNCGEPKGEGRSRLERAVEVYRGPLLAGFDDDWLIPERQRLAERYLRALRRLTGCCEAAGETDRALDWARRAVCAEPLHEESHVELARLLLACGQPIAALDQYRALERMLSEKLGRRPSPAAAALAREIDVQVTGETSGERRRPRAGAARRSPAEPRNRPAALPPRAPAPDLEPEGGAVPLSSPFYVERETDAQFAAAVRRGDSIVLVKGARQVGKTSLLARALEQARQAGARVALTDFQLLNAEHLNSVDTCLRALAQSLADEMELEVGPEDEWDPRRGPNPNFRRYLRRQVLSRPEQAVAWGLDEVDRLFTCPFGSEVFGLFRALHNERALNPGAPWARLTLAIAYATEAHLFIADLNQSPFNVGTRLTLADFTFEQVADLNRRYGCPLRDQQELARYYRLVGGHPFLAQRGLHELAVGRLPFAALEAEADQEGGAFGDHLRRLSILLARDAELAETVRRVLAGQQKVEPSAFYRLRAAGLLTGVSPLEAQLRCELYARYLQRCLGPA